MAAGLEVTRQWARDPAAAQEKMKQYMTDAVRNGAVQPCFEAAEQLVEEMEIFKPGSAKLFYSMVALLTLQEGYLLIESGFLSEEEGQKLFSLVQKLVPGISPGKNPRVEEIQGSAFFQEVKASGRFSIKEMLGIFLLFSAVVAVLGMFFNWAYQGWSGKDVAEEVLGSDSIEGVAVTTPTKDLVVEQFSNAAETLKGMIQGVINDHLAKKERGEVKGDPILPQYDEYEGFDYKIIPKWTPYHGTTYHISVEYGDELGKNIVDKASTEALQNFASKYLKKMLDYESEGWDKWISEGRFAKGVAPVLRNLRLRALYKFVATTAVEIPWYAFKQQVLSGESESETIRKLPPKLTAGLILAANTFKYALLIYAITEGLYDYGGARYLIHRASSEFAAYTAQIQWAWTLDAIASLVPTGPIAKLLGGGYAGLALAGVGKGLMKGAANKIRYDAEVKASTLKAIGGALIKPFKIVAWETPKFIYNDFASPLRVMFGNTEKDPSRLESFIDRGAIQQNVLKDSPFSKKKTFED